MKTITETNKAVMNRFVAFINTASEKLAEELISPGAIFYVPGQTEPMKGPVGYLTIIKMMRSGFPDIQWSLEDIVAEGTRWLSVLLCAEHIKVVS